MKDLDFPSLSAYHLAISIFACISVQRPRVNNIDFLLIFDPKFDLRFELPGLIIQDPDIFLW